MMKDTILYLSGIGCGITGLVILGLWFRYGIRFFNDELKRIKEAP